MPKRGVLIKLMYKMTKHRVLMILVLQPNPNYYLALSIKEEMKLEA
jgi:hypothetical protein